MAIRYAVATGSWSNTATWDGGTLPGAGDEVFANSFTVTIDQDINVGSISTIDNIDSGVVTGGEFTVSGTRTIDLTGSGVVAGTTSCLIFAGTSAGTINTTDMVPSQTTANVAVLDISTSGSVTLDCASAVVGPVGGSGASRRQVVLSGTGAHNFTAPEFRGGSATGFHAIDATAFDGDIVIFGDLAGSSSGVASSGMNGGSGNTTVTGNVIGGSGASSFGFSPGQNATVLINGNIVGALPSAALNLESLGITATISGNVTGGPGSNRYGIQIRNNSVVTVNGNVAGGSGGNAYGVGIANVVAAASAIVTINGNVTGGTSTNTSNKAAGVATLRANTTPITINGNVTSAAVAPGVLVNTTSSKFRINGIISTTSSNLAVEATVSSAEIIVSGEIDSSAGKIFPIDRIAKIVSGETIIKMDNETGVSTFTDDPGGAAFTNAEIAEAVWGYELSLSSVTGSFGERISNVSTVETTGAQIVSFLGGSVTPSAAGGSYNGTFDADLIAIAGAVWNFALTAADTQASIGERVKEAATVATTGAQLAGFGD
jgi:hypothetical protein